VVTFFDKCRLGPTCIEYGEIQKSRCNGPKKCIPVLPLTKLMFPISALRWNLGAKAPMQDICTVLLQQRLQWFKHIVITFQVRVQERLLGIRNIFKILLELLA
jgi:hypothetical protein